MEYVTEDGSKFELRAVWKNDADGIPTFDYTTVTAYVGGVAYVGKLDQHPEEVDEGDVLDSLKPVPVECIHPVFQDGWTVAPAWDPTQHYLKAPSFTYDDCQPGETFVADCVSDEVTTLEKLKNRPHPNIGVYHGCVVKNGRVTHIRLKRYASNLVEYTQCSLSEAQRTQLYQGVRDGILHLHTLALAHNDINPLNICVDITGEPVIIDFDSCLPPGFRLMKGVGTGTDSEVSVSAKDNDLLRGLQTIATFLWGEDGDWIHPDWASRDNIYARHATEDYANDQ